MLPSTSRSSGLDISLLGAIVAILAFYAGNSSYFEGAAPHLIRFFDKPPGTTYPAVMPQDKALLLLADPSTTASTGSTASIPIPAGGWALLMYVGLLMVVIGPLWAWVRGEV